MTSDDEGATWPEEQLLAGDPFNEIEPAVVGTPSGRVIVAWEAQTEEGRIIQYSTSDDGGATWDGPFWADDPDTVFEARDPDLAVAPSGDVWLIYNGALVTEEEKRDGLLRQISDDDGTSWSPAEVVQGGFCCQNIAGTPEGLVLTWWQGEFIGEPFNYWNDDVHYRTTEDEGATWSLPIRYTMYPGQDVLPSVAGLDAGGFALAWRSDRRRGDSGYTTEQAIWFGKPQPKSGGTW